jgi:hypothetical protein
MKEEEKIVKTSTTEEATLEDINRRHNLSISLSSIIDETFSFFTSLCEACLKLLASENLSKDGEEIFNHSFNQLTQNQRSLHEFYKKK